MKKIWIGVVSLTLSAFMLLTGCLTAFAEQPKTNWKPRPNAQDAIGYVNGVEHGDLIWAKGDPKTGGTKITYIGEGAVTGWEFPLLTEGKDYEILDKGYNYITIEVLTENQALPYINVLVDFDEPTNADAKNNKTTERVTEDTTHKQITTSDKGQTNSESDTTVISETESKTEPVSNKEPEAEMQNRVPVMPIVLVCVFAAVATAAGIIIYKKHKNNFPN